MHYLNSHIERLQKNLSEIKLKFGNGIEAFDCYFICKIHTSKNNIYNNSSFYGNGKLYETTEIKITSGGKDNENDNMVVLHIGFNPDALSYEDLLPYGSKSAYSNLPEISESYDEFGNRIDNLGDKLYYKYNRDGYIISSKSWCKKRQLWINRYYFDEDNMSTMLIGDDFNNLILLLHCKYSEGNETERFIYDSGLELVLRTEIEHDENERLVSSTSYLPDGKVAWRIGNEFAYDINNELVYKELEFEDDELGSITLFLYHHKYLEMWDKSLNRNYPLSLGDLLNIACFGEDEELWIDPYPDFE